MDGLSLSSWIILFLGFFICFGGALYSLLIAMGKRPERILDTLGITGPMESSMDTLVEMGIYRPFEYMDRGPKEKAVGMAVLFVLLTIGWGLGVFEADSGSMAPGARFDLIYKQGALDPIDGYSDENSEQSFFVTIAQEHIVNITFTLTWEDEAPPPGFENHPDEFSLNVTTVWGESAETPMTQNDPNTRRGEVSLTFRSPLTYPEIGSAGEYLVVVRMGEAGDVWPLGIPSVGFADDGNEWTLNVEYDFQELRYIG